MGTASDTTAVSGSPASTPAPDPRPTPASSRGPARNIPLPVLPEAAKQNTKEGFEAFTQYWFDTVTYAQATGDTSLLSASSTTTCKVCARYLQLSHETYASGGWYIAPIWNLSDFATDMKPDANNQYFAYFVIDEKPSVRFGSAGDVLESLAGEARQTPKVIYAGFAEGHWRVTEAGES